MFLLAISEGFFCPRGGVHPSRPPLDPPMERKQMEGKVTVKKTREGTSQSTCGKGSVPQHDLKVRSTYRRPVKSCRAEQTKA